MKNLSILLRVLVSLLPNFIKIPLLRVIFGAQIGNGVKIGFGALLLCRDITIGNSCKISPFTLIRAHKISIGQRTNIGLFTRIMVYELELSTSVTIGPQVSIMADINDPRCTFSAGAETWVFEYCYINPARPIRLGRNVGVGGGTYIFAHGLWLSQFQGYPVTFAEVTIGNDVWVPWGCFIMPGVNIGDGAVIGARSLVTKDVPANSLAAGSPAKVLKENFAIKPELNDQIDALRHITDEFAQNFKIRVQYEENENWLIVKFDNSASLAFSTSAEVNFDKFLDKNILLIVADEYKILHARHPDKLLYSLQSFQGPSRAQLSEVQLNWLKNLRQTGTRYYPHDEIIVEE